MNFSKHRIQNYIKAFPFDGYTYEGISYWSYGVGHFFELRDWIVRGSSGLIDIAKNQIGDLDSKIKNIMLFPLRFEMAPGTYAAFGDASLGYKGLGKGFVDYINATLGSRFPYTASTQDMSYFYSLRQKSSTNGAIPLIHLRLENNTQLNSFVGSQYFESAGALISKFQTSNLALTIKDSGNNVGDHWHYDIGSYSISVDGIFVTGDQGGFIRYNDNSFNLNRPLSNIVNSYGHPVPLVDGKKQISGKTLSPDVSLINRTDLSGFSRTLS